MHIVRGACAGASAAGACLTTCGSTWTATLICPVRKRAGHDRLCVVLLRDLLSLRLCHITHTHTHVRAYTRTHTHTHNHAHRSQMRPPSSSSSRPWGRRWWLPTSLPRAGARTPSTTSRLWRRPSRRCRGWRTRGRRRVRCACVRV